MDARNMQRSEINILNRIVDLVGLIREIIQECTVKKNLKYTHILQEIWQKIGNDDERKKVGGESS